MILFAGRSKRPMNARSSMEARARASELLLGNFDRTSLSCQKKQVSRLVSRTPGLPNTKHNSHSSNRCRQDVSFSIPPSCIRSYQEDVLFTSRKKHPINCGPSLVEKKKAKKSELSQGLICQSLLARRNSAEAWFCQSDTPPLYHMITHGRMVFVVMLRIEWH